MKINDLHARPLRVSGCGPTRAASGRVWAGCRAGTIGGGRLTNSTRGGKPQVKALVYHGPGKKSWESKEDPKLERATDAVVKIDTTTICGTDLHILKGDVPAVTDGRTLGHEAVGTVVETGTAVANVKEGDKV